MCQEGTSTIVVCAATIHTVRRSRSRTARPGVRGFRYRRARLLRAVSTVRNIFQTQRRSTDQVRRSGRSGAPVAPEENGLALRLRCARYNRIRGEVTITARETARMTPGKPIALLVVCGEPPSPPFLNTAA
jgi:hypothetical protein